MDFCPYDNVEFPVRPSEGPPQPQVNHQVPQQQKFYHQTLVRDKKTSTLSPVKEHDDIKDDIDAALEGQGQQRHTLPMMSHGTTSSTSTGRLKDTTVNIDKETPIVTTAEEEDTLLIEPKIEYSPKSSPLQGKAKSNTLQGKTKSNTSLQGKTKTMDSKIVVTDQPRLNTWSDFNPASMDLLQTAYKRHHGNFYKLNEKILDKTEDMKEDVWKLSGKMGETLSYEQLLQGMLEEGEMLVLGGSWLCFTHLYFLDAETTTPLKPPLGRGRICLTNKKLLILSAENVSDASLEEYGDPLTPDGGYKLSVSKYNSIFFQNVPLGCFHSVELQSRVGTAQQSRLSLQKPCCCGLCSCFGIGRCRTRWKASNSLEVPINRQTVEISASLPPLGRQALIVVYLNPELSLTLARDFVTQLHRHAPLLH